jgi:hypothetical protein
LSNVLVWSTSIPEVGHFINHRGERLQ